METALSRPSRLVREQPGTGGEAKRQEHLGGPVLIGCAGRARQHISKEGDTLRIRFQCSRVQYWHSRPPPVRLWTPTESISVRLARFLDCSRRTLSRSCRRVGGTMAILARLRVRRLRHTVENRISLS